MSSFYTPCMVLSSSFSCRAILYWSGPIWKILSSLTLFESCQVPVKSGTFLKAIGSVFVPWTYQCTTGNPVQTMDEGILMTNTSVQMSTADGYRRKQSPKHLRGCLLWNTPTGVALSQTFGLFWIAFSRAAAGSCIESGTADTYSAVPVGCWYHRWQLASCYPYFIEMERHLRLVT